MNFGPKTMCFPYKDFGNLAYGFCAVTALGRYNPKMGGHLILWDLKLAIEFPPGCTILIPSATLHHSRRFKNGRIECHALNTPLEVYLDGLIMVSGCRTNSKPRTPRVKRSLTGILLTIGTLGYLYFLLWKSFQNFKFELARSIINRKWNIVVELIPDYPVWIWNMIMEYGYRI
jgi:hypothetical protein